MMRTDELRNDLHNLASELEPFEGDPSLFRGHVQRRRLAIVGVALVVTVALAVPEILFATSEPGRSAGGADPARRSRSTTLLNATRLSASSTRGQHAFCAGRARIFNGCSCIPRVAAGCGDHTHVEGGARLIVVPRPPRQLSRRPQGRSSGSRHTESPTRRCRNCARLGQAHCECDDTCGVRKRTPLGIEHRSRDNGVHVDRRDCRADRRHAFSPRG